MLAISFLAASLFLSSISALPLQKRIAQVIADSTAQWEKACDAAGGGQQCNPLSVTAFTTLLAAAGNCDQQNAADNMIDLAKTLNNDPTMIKLTQIFVQQPRNTPNSLAVPYCDTAPRNSELNGLFQCQFQGANQASFVGGLKVGAPSTIPFGLSSPVNPAGSCPANPSGPIADGTQLVDLTQNPGTGSSSGSASAPPAAASSASSSSAPPASSPAPAKSSTGSSSSSSGSSSSSSSSSSSGSFQLQNGLAAQKLNAQFATLTASSPCDASTLPNACIGTSFAQCVNGAFVLSDCGKASGLTCAALPLVNKEGTSVTCTTPADALSRIQATGATGGLTGNGGGADESSTASATAPANVAVSSPASSPAPATGSSSSSSSSSFLLQNGLAAQKLNAQFASLTASSPCDASTTPNACIGSSFAQCVNGAFVLSDCGKASGLTCAALPLVNKEGTSVTCTTPADALSRIQATGASGGLTGQ